MATCVICNQKDVTADDPFRCDDCWNVPLPVGALVIYRKQAVKNRKVVLDGAPITAIITELDIAPLALNRYIVETEAGWVDSLAETQLLAVSP